MRARGLAGAGLALGLLAVAGLLAGRGVAAQTEPWHPTFREGGGGEYCATSPQILPETRPSRKSPRGLRGPRGGLIVVRDYERPLELMPPSVRRPPRSGRLPFGPASLELRPSVRRYGERLRAAGERFGFTLVNDGRVPLALGWTAIARMWAVHREGPMHFSFELVDSSTEIVGEIAVRRRQQVALPAPEAPGIYRFTTTLESEDGAHRAGYGEYLRVLPSHRRARLDTKRGSYRPGQVVYARVENRGTDWIAYEWEYSVELLTPSGWREVGPHRLLVPRGPPPVLGPGRAECFDFRIPKGAAPDRYRVVRTVEYGRGRIGQRLKADLTAEFEVAR